MVIAPGKTTSMEIKATPLQIGEKYVDITLTTDSPLSSPVVVKLHIIGSRKAPYMSEARGDLSFSGDARTGDSRSINVDCIELLGSRPKLPNVKNDLEYIDLSEPILEKEGPTTSPGAVHRRYLIKARLKSQGMGGNDYGQITIVDPWDPDHFQAIHVHREVTPPLKVSPQRAFLKAGNAGDARDATAKFVIMSREPITDLFVELEDAAVAPLSLSSLLPDDDKRMFFFSISLKPVVSSGNIYYIRIGRLNSPDRIRVPIAVRTEAFR